jgi:hypothetical protein
MGRRREGAAMKDTADTEGRDWPWALGLAVAAGLMRLLPGMPVNFTPIGALGLFAGARFRSWRAFVVPLAVMAGSDLLLWWARNLPPFDPFVYASFALYVAAGWLFLKRASVARVAAVTLAGSAQFFLITNFGVWLSASASADRVPTGAAVVWEDVPGLSFPVPVAYTRDLSGLAACYAAALPFVRTNAPPFGFFGNTVAGDLLFVSVLFGLAALARRALTRGAVAAGGVA